MIKPNKPTKNQFHKYLQLSGVGIQMGVTIYLGAFFGKKLDVIYPNEKNLYTLLLVLAAFVISMISLIVQIKRINQKYD